MLTGRMTGMMYLCQEVGVVHSPFSLSEIASCQSISFMYWHVGMFSV